MGGHSRVTAVGKKALVATACPSCGSAVASAAPDTQPWCPSCEWNLDVYDRALAPWRGSSLVGRWGFRRGVALDALAREQLLADPDEQPRGRSTGELWLLGVSAVLGVLGLAAAGYLVWLFVGTDLPVGVRLVLALPAVAILALMVPSVGRVPDDLVVDAETTPELHALVRDVAAAAGAPAPEVIAVDMSLNAGVGLVGWRQRSVLVIGMPLWLTVPRAARLSVLAHEVGHLANGDPLRMRRTLLARAFGARAVAATGGRNPWSRAVAGGTSAAEQGGGLVGFVVHGLLAVVNVTAATLQLLVDAVAMPDSRRAEYRADIVAARVAGRQAFLAASEALLVADRVWQDLWHIAPRIGADELERSATVGRQAVADRVAVQRQLTRRTTDLWSTHPSEDQRMRLVESLPATEPTCRVDDARWDRIDAELAPWRRRAHRALLGTRDPW